MHVYLVSERECQELNRVVKQLISNIYFAISY